MAVDLGPLVPFLPGADKEPPAQLKSWDEAKTLKPGSDFIDPEGNKHVVPYKTHQWDDVMQVPEGADFIDPEGRKRTKPRYEGVGFTAQTLYDMSLTDDAKGQALKKVYGDKVKKGVEGYYVDDEGTLRKPDGRGLTGSVGHAAAEAAPLAGMTLGMLGGGALGTGAEPGGGTAAGGYLGMVLGAAGGRQVNNVILSLAGIHESAQKQVQSMVTEGAFAAGGEVIGKGLTATKEYIGALPEAMDATGKKLNTLVGSFPVILEKLGVKPEQARKFLGITKESAEQAADVTNRGAKVSPSAAFKEAPALAKAEEFDRVFRAQDVFAQANEAFYNQEAKKLAEHPDIGASIDELLTKAEKKVSSEKAGQALIDAATRDMAHDDAVLENMVHDVKQSVVGQVKEMGGEEAARKMHEGKVAALNEAHKNAELTARKLIDAQVDKLHTDVGTVLSHITKNGENPSGLVKMVGAQFKLYSAALRTRAKVLYNAYHDATNGLAPEESKIVGLADDAEAFLKSMPEFLRKKYPAEIRDLAKLSGHVAEEAEEAEGIEAKEPTRLSYAELHHLRSWFRYGIDYEDMTPDMRAGSMKLFESKIDKLLEEGPHHEMLERADAFYKDKIPFLNDEMIKTTLKALKSGAGVNPEVLADTLFDPSRTDALRKVRSVIGEHSWREVQAAHLRNMLDQSKMIDGNIDATEFAKQVHADVKNGLLKNAYDEATSKRVSEIAENTAKLNGKLPIRPEADDTISTLMRRAQSAKEQAEKFAENDPLTALKGEMDKLDKELAEGQKRLQQGRQRDPLKFLYDPKLSHAAVSAADKILKNSDLTRVAAGRFGRDSPGFHALRQVYVMRFLQRPFGATAAMRAQLGGEHGITEEMQALMFPGVTRGQMLQLARDMEFLFSGSGSDMGGAMAAAARVLNPESHIPIPKPRLGPVGDFLVHTPVVAGAMRYTIGKYYALMVDAVSHPNFINWLAENLKGNQIQRDVARAVVQQRLALGGWFGATAAEMVHNREQKPARQMRRPNEARHSPQGEMPAKQPEKRSEASHSWLSNLNPVSSAEAAEGKLPLPPAIAQNIGEWRLLANSLTQGTITPLQLDRLDELNQIFKRAFKKVAN